MTWRRVSLGLAWLLAGVACAPLSTPPPAMTFTAEPFATLTWYLDCRAGLMRCTRGGIDRVWEEEIGWQPSDDATLNGWRAARRHYDAVQAPIEDDALSLLPLPGGFRGIDIGKRVRIAGLVATSPAAYADRLELLVAPGDAARLAAFTDAFWHRFEAWWATGPAERGRAAVAQLAAGSAAPALGAFLGEARAFYAADAVADIPIHFHVFVLPPPTDTDTDAGTVAEQLEQHSALEVRPGADPRSLLAVAGHEICHYYWDNARPEVLAAFATHLSVHADPTVQNLWGLANESLATALGNGVLARRLRGEAHLHALIAKKRSFYRDDTIDAVAKAFLPVVDAALARRAPLSDPATLDGLVSAGQRAVGPSLGSLANTLRIVQLQADEGLEDIADRLLRDLRPSQVSSSTPVDAPDGIARLRRYPGLSAIVLLTRPNLAQLDAYAPLVGVDAVRALKAYVSASPDRALAYGLSRAGRGHIFVLIGDDPAALAALLPAWSATASPWSGPGPRVR